MKKAFLCVLALMLMLAMCGMAFAAVEAEPGDTITVSVDLSASGAAYVVVKVSFDTSALEFVSAQGGMVAPDKEGGNFVFASLETFNSAKGTVTVKVKEGAKPGSSYPVTAKVIEALDIDGGDISASATGQTIKIVCHHTSTEWKEKVAPTCTEKGTKVEVCKTCGEELNTADIDELGHDDGAWDITLEPTCLEDGHKVLKCTRCSTQLDETDIDPLGHDESGEWNYDEAPTCTEGGYGRLFCVRCNVMIREEPVEALGHDNTGEWEIDLQPTCLEKGHKILKCVRCSEQIDEAEIDALGHDNTGKWQITKEATCIEDGTKILKCVRCSEQIDEQVIPMSADYHKAGKWVVETKETCKTDGEKAKYCTICNEELDRATIKKHHMNVVSVTEIEPTYEADGSYKRVCKACGANVGTGIIPMLVKREGVSAGVAGVELNTLGEAFEGSEDTIAVITSEDAEYSFELVADDFVVGTLNIKIVDGKLVASFTVAGEAVELCEGTISFIDPVTGEVTEFELDSEVDVSELNLLCLCAKLCVSFDTGIGELDRFDFEADEYVKRIEEMTQILGE